uniref:FYVE-type domain-containing protein n=1 Tax=Globisporangium ultimum (strain ATCC 200006 / CBS 805.95 / DAOM BR144) TaxID=431595 RepID=K3WAT8_GLOUD
MRLAKKSKGLRFPLPEGFFPQIKLTPEQVDQYAEQMEDIVSNALVEYNRHEAMGERPVYAEPWKWMCSVEDLTAIQHQAPSTSNSNSSSSSAATKFRIFGRIKGDYRHQMDFYYAETSKELFEWNQIMFGTCVDAAVLANIHTASSGKSHMYMGFKWVCLNPGRILTRKRDRCYLEYMAFTKDFHGRDVGIRVNVPIVIPECPDLSDRLNVKRMNTTTVMIVREAENDKGSTDFFMLGEHEISGSYVNSAYYKSIMNTMKDMAVFVDSRRISQKGFRDREDWVPRVLRNACAICQRNFSATRRHHHCRLCGEVICGSCVIVRKAPSVGTPSSASSKKTFTSVKTKICFKCVTHIRESDSASVDFAASQMTFKLDDDDQDGVNNQRVALSRTTSEVSELDDEATGWGWDAPSEQRRSSMCSDTRSSTCSTASMSGSSSFDKISFATKLDVIEDQREEGELIDFSKDLECLEEVTEVIDTKQMKPLSATLLEPPALSSRSMRFLSEPVHAASPNGLRAIDQCLAEQEQLLRQMVLAASTVSTRS